MEAEYFSKTYRHIGVSREVEIELERYCKGIEPIKRNRLVVRRHKRSCKCAERVGKKRATVANYLRLLKLPAEIQLGIKEKKIDMGHARALLALDDPKTQIRIFNEIQSQGYSVRKVDEIVKALSAGEEVASGGKKIRPAGNKLSEEYTMLQNHLCGFFGSKVQLSCTAKGKGKISIPFNNEEDLERIMEILDSLKKKEE